VDDIRPFRGLPEIAAELQDLGYGRSRVGLVGFNSTIQTVTTFLHGEVKLLERALPDAELIDFSWALQQMRIVKSEEAAGCARLGGGDGDPRRTGRRRLCRPCPQL